MTTSTVDCIASCWQAENSQTNLHFFPPVSKLKRLWKSVAVSKWLSGAQSLRTSQCCTVMPQFIFPHSLFIIDFRRSSCAYWGKFSLVQYIQDTLCTFSNTAEACAQARRASLSVWPKVQHPRTMLTLPTYLFSLIHKPTS